MLRGRRSTRDIYESDMFRGQQADGLHFGASDLQISQDDLA